jgi:transcriptional regulator with XRE-family HTH domain
MAKNTRRHLPPSDMTPDSPAEIGKLEFGRRLSKHIIDRGWNQSDLARAAGLGRDAISTYVRGRSFPEPRSLKALADALRVEPTALLPNEIALALKSDTAPMLEIKQAAGHPDYVYLRINRMVSLDQAAQIFSILKDIKA